MASNSRLNRSGRKHLSKPKSECGVLMEHQMPKIENEAEDKHSLQKRRLHRSENCDPNIMLLEMRQQKQNSHKLASVHQMQRVSKDALSNSKLRAENGFMTSPSKHVSKSRKCAVSNSDSAVPVPVQPRKTESFERVRKKRQPCFHRTISPGEQHDYGAKDHGLESKERIKSTALQFVEADLELFRSANCHPDVNFIGTGLEAETNNRAVSICTSKSQLDANAVQDSKFDKHPVLETENLLPMVVQKQDIISREDSSAHLDHLGIVAGMENGNESREEHPSTFDNSPVAVEAVTDIVKAHDIPLRIGQSRSLESEYQISEVQVEPYLISSIAKSHTWYTKSTDAPQKREEIRQCKLNSVLEVFQSMSPSQEGRVKTLIRAFESLMSCPENKTLSSKSQAWSYLRGRSPNSKENVNSKAVGLRDLEGKTEMELIEREQKCQSPLPETVAEINGYLRRHSPNTKENVNSKAAGLRGLEGKTEMELIERKQKCQSPLPNTAAEINGCSEYNHIKSRCPKDATQAIKIVSQYIYSNDSALVGLEHKMDTVQGNLNSQLLVPRTTTDEYDDGSKEGRQNVVDSEFNHIKRKYSRETTQILAEDLINGRTNFDTHIAKGRWSLDNGLRDNEPHFLADQQLEEDAETGPMEAQRKRFKGNISKPQPFKLLTEERGLIKEQQFVKKLEELFAEEERLRIPIAQGLPWSTDEPEIVPKPPVKDQTKPIDIHLFTEVRAIERADFDHFVEEKLFSLEQQRLEEEKLRQIAEEEEIRRMRKEMIPRAQLMPYFDQPFKPKRSSKPLTIPKEPMFHYFQKKRAKCITLDDR